MKKAIITSLKTFNESENSTETTAEELFKQLIQGIDISKPRVDFKNYPNSMFWFKGNKCIFQYNFKNNDFWIDYSNFWIKFKPYFNGNYNDIQDFMKLQVEQHFNLKGITPPQPLELHI